MKRQVSISIFLALFVILLTLLYIRFFNETKPEENTQMNEQLVQDDTGKSITISQEYITYPFYIKDEDGWLVVYHSKTGERYMDTGIAVDVLPMDRKMELESGIFFRTEAELYDFLESYSS